MFALSRILRTTCTTSLTTARLFSSSKVARKDNGVDEPSAKGIKSGTRDSANQASRPAPDNKNEQSAQASRGKQANENYSGGKDNADTRGDPGNMNKKAEADHPEAPKPVIGMKEERGKSQE